MPGLNGVNIHNEAESFVALTLEMDLDEIALGPTCRQIGIAAQALPHLVSNHYLCDCSS